MYKDLQPTCPAIVLLIKLFVWRRSRCRCRCRWLKAASDTTSKEFQLKTRRGFSFTVRSSLHCNLDAFELKLYRTLLDKDRENHRCSLINQVMYYMIIFYMMSFNLFLHQGHVSVFFSYNFLNSHVKWTTYLFILFLFSREREIIDCYCTRLG